METITRPILECGVAARARHAWSESGDRHVLCPFPGGALVGVLDGLGHGREASEAALAAASVLEEHAAEPLPSLIRRCHEQLRFGRGVVMSLASFRTADASMTWMGVGNVEGVLLRAPDRVDLTPLSLTLRAGVVGAHLPEVSAETHAVVRGDMLVLTTDGIRVDSFRGIGRALSSQRIADLILARSWKGTDDGLVLIARFSGGSS